MENILQVLLNRYIKDPQNFNNNFLLAYHYDSIGQTATAISYYLRSAERSDDPLVQYECLIRASMCFDRQGTRNFTVKGLLQHAISLCPQRPEAYYLLSRFYEHEDKEGAWNDSYLIASIGETVSDFNSDSLRTEIDYPGKYGILYQKALAAWWCGLCDESRNIFNDLNDNYDLDENHKNKVNFHLLKLNKTNKNLHEVYYKEKDVKKEFDWGIFKHDQMLHDCFKRDILENYSYEKLFEVEEDDVVLDVGASVGPFTYSILKKNPKLSICLEPHPQLFKTLTKNLSEFSNVVCLQKGISNVDGEVIFETLYDETTNHTSWEKKEQGLGISLKTLVEEYDLNKIDFLKIDCEGGEYDFFTEENFDWITQNVKKISGEWHFYRDHTREKFHWFRDKYLKYFNNYKIFFIDNDSNFYDITSELWNDDFCQKYGWVNIYIDNRNSFDSSKLEGFPSVYCTSLDESSDRREHIEEQFKKYNLEVTSCIFDRFENYNHKILGYNIKNLDQRTLGPITSHIKMLYDWYYNSDEPYAVFCEDDISLETVQYWNFTWKEFFEKLPENWECIQMCLISESKKDVVFKDRQIHDWGCQAYMVKKEFVKRILDKHYQHVDYVNDTFDFTISDKSFLTPVIEHVLFDGKGKVYNCPLFVEDIYKFNSTYLQEENRINSFNSYNNILNWWKENGRDTELDKIMEKKTKIIDFCSFYGPYGSEMLLLRYNILKDYVDEFVISESRYSHTGIPVEFECKKKIKEWGLPEEKFKVIELETPPDEELVIEYIDELNCIDALSGNQQTNMKSKWARVRDRLSKDALLNVLNDYDDDTVFIHGDIDEIINPSYIPDLINICKNDDNAVIYIPLVYLEGRADLRVYNKTWNCPQAWDWAMFMCKKSVLEKATPVQLRSHKLVPEEIYKVNLVNNWNNEPVVDVGWHFSWMGGKESRLVKKQSWEHRYDSFDWLVTKKYDESDEFLSTEYKEGDTPPCGNVDLILKSYPKENLPKEIFELPIVENFLFPGKNYSIKIEDIHSPDLLDKLDWGLFNYNDKSIEEKEYTKLEINNGIYTKFFDVEEGDIVFDVGASIGPFAASILKKNPKEIHCFEPNKKLYKSLENNLGHFSNVYLNCYAIEKYNEQNLIVDTVITYENEDIEKQVDTITFESYIKDNNIKKIDFLKTDSEGGEWTIFTEENYDWITKNVRKISGEFHLLNEDMKNNFIKFRDLYLKNAKNVIAFNSNQYAKVKEIDIWDDEFVLNDLIYCVICFEFTSIDCFLINVNCKSTSWVIDNFYKDPDYVREFALNQEYLEGGLGRGFIGRRTHQQFLFPGLKEKFEEIMGRKITKWEEYGMNGRFQVAWSGEPLVYHCDDQKWGGMLYLTPNAPYQCGTTLYANKKTKARTYYDEGWNDAWTNVPGDCHLDGTPFEPVDVLGNVYNRLVIFDASCIHSASQYFGTVMGNGRLWQMFFFDT